jgi:hypothetical protein
MAPTQKIAVLSVAVSVLFVSTLFLLFLNLQKPVSSSPPVTGIIPTSVPQSNPETSWKTYENKKYGFSFNYPKEWEFTTQQNYNIPYYGEGFYFSTCGTSTLYMSLIDLNQPDTAYKSIDEFFQKSPNLVPIIPWKNIDISGVTGKYYQNEGEPGSVTPSVTIVIYNQTNNTIIRLYFTDGCRLGLDQAIKKYLDQILSTFKFTNIKTTVPSPTTTAVKTIKYNLYQNWLSVRDYSQLFEVGYDPATQDLKMSAASIDIIQKPTQPNQYVTPRASYALKDYDGGSRHTFLYSFFGGKLTSQDKFPDFKEVEYTIDGKTCLFLDGISYSQFPAVWGMCPITGSKALLITTGDRQNYVKTLSTIKFPK